MRGTAFQKRVQALVRQRPAPGCHCALNSLRHISRAWRIKKYDPEMAFFRAGCAEEEAATSVFHSLKRIRYSGAEALNLRSHLHKYAVNSFVWAIHKSLHVPFSMGLKVTTHLPKEGQDFKPYISIRLPGSDKVLRPVPPLHFETGFDGKQYDFQVELDSLTKGGGFKSTIERLRVGVRNRQLPQYAVAQGIPKLDPEYVEQFVRQVLGNVTKILTIYLLIDCYPQKQLYVQQALNAFLKLLNKLPHDFQGDLTPVEIDNLLEEGSLELEGGGNIRWRMGT